jgi:hypothetical protein
VRVGGADTCGSVCALVIKCGLFSIRVEMWPMLMLPRADFLHLSLNICTSGSRKAPAVREADTGKPPLRGMQRAEARCRSGCGQRCTADQATGTPPQHVRQQPGCRSAGLGRGRQAHATCRADPHCMAALAAVQTQTGLPVHASGCAVVRGGLSGLPDPSVCPMRTNHAERCSSRVEVPTAAPACW